MKDIKSFLSEMLTPGTTACTIFGVVVGLVFAILWLVIGVGKTLLIALFCLIGAFVGGVKNKADFIRSVILFFHRGEGDR